jgi:hypothetical protein
MKYFCLFLLVLLQEPQNALITLSDTYGEQTVSHALSTKGGSLSFTEKAINRLGDRAAIGLMRLIEDHPVGNVDQIKDILGVIRNAFSAPSIITVEEDRQPKATLFLLYYLRNLPVSETIRPEIDETRAFVLRNVKNN